MKPLFMILACGLLAGQLPLTTAQPQTDTGPTAPGSFTAPYYGPLYGAPRPQRANPATSIRRWADSDGYHLQIFTGSDDPQAVDIRLRGRSLLLRSARSYQTDRRDSTGIRSYERRFNRFSRQISIPRDADTANMRSRVEDGVMTITLPRLKHDGEGLRDQSRRRFGLPREYR